MSVDNEPKFGFVPFAELWNGRLAMLGFVALLITEFANGGKGLLHVLGLLQ